MRKGRLSVIASVLVAVVAVPALAAPGASTVTVNLRDTSSADWHDTPDGQVMVIDADRVSVPAGQVHFAVTNRSASLTHEMLVVSLPRNGAALPYSQSKGEVPEEKVHAMGEVSELPPGKSGSLDVTLQPGSYLLMCNVAGHYMQGMTRKFTVTP